MQEYTSDELVEIGRWIFEIEPISQPIAPISGAVDFRQFHELIFSRIHLPPLRMDHNPKRLLGFDNEHLLFEIVESGEKLGISEDMLVEQSRGSVHLIDMSRRYSCVVQNVVGSGILIPHAAVDFDPSRHSSYFTHSITSDRGRLLHMAAVALANRVFAQSPAAETWIFYNAFLSLIKTLLLNQATFTTSLSDTEASIFAREIIERNLTNPELGADFLASQLGVSRSSVYRIFKDDGGIARFISERRLQNAFADLIGITAERGAIRRTALRWGFSDPSTFQRRFRDRFGITPTDCLMGRNAAADSQASPVWHPVIDWISVKK